MFTSSISGSLQLALVMFDVIQPHTRMFPQLMCFRSRRSNAISLWSKYPHRLPLSPVKMTFRKMSFRPVLHGSSLAQGGKIPLVKWNFSAVRTCQLHAVWREKPWKVIRVCRVVSSWWLSLVPSAQTGERLFEPRRCEETQLFLMCLATNGVIQTKRNVLP